MLRLACMVSAVLATPMTGVRAQMAGHQWYIVPGVQYGTPTRTSYSLTAFRDGRGGIVGRGYLAKFEGGGDAARAHVGIANVSNPLGYALQVTGLRTLSRPMDGRPSSNYAGAEAHLLITVVNLGVGFYAPVGDPHGRRGLFGLSAGVGF